MSRHKRYSVETVNVPRQFWEGWLTKLQKKAFGWEFSEGYSETEHGIDSNWNHTETTTHYYVFKRFSPYTGNILFNLAEMISNLICFLRRIVGLLFIPAVVVLFILAFFGMDPSTLGTIGAYVVMAPFVAIIFGLLAAIVGSLMKKIFRIEEKLQDDMEEKGYDYDRLD